MNDWEPGDYLYPRAAGVYIVRQMFQVLEPLPDNLLASPMRWYGDGEPGPWSWLNSPSLIGAPA
jgi:hypothetical protein